MLSALLSLVLLAAGQDEWVATRQNGELVINGVVNTTQPHKTLLKVAAPQGFNPKILLVDFFLNKSSEGGLRHSPELIVKDADYSGVTVIYSTGKIVQVKIK